MVSASLEQERQEMDLEELENLLLGDEILLKKEVERDLAAGVSLTVMSPWIS